MDNATSTNSVTQYGLESLAEQLNTLLADLVRTRSWHRWLVEVQVPELAPGGRTDWEKREMLIAALRSNLSRWDAGAFSPPPWLGEVSEGWLTFIGRSTANGALVGLPAGWELLVYANLNLHENVSMRDRIVMWVTAGDVKPLEVRIDAFASVERLVEFAEAAGFSVTVPARTSMKWTVVS